MNPTVTNELLFDYFAGRSTEMEKAHVEAWLREPTHVEQFYALLEEYERRFPQFTPDTDRHLRAFVQRLNETPATDAVEAVPDAGVPRRWRPWRWGLAASVALVLTGGWLARDVIRYQSYTTDFAQTRALRLPDGTGVTLNANSTLRVPRWGFSEADRVVFLSGEAEFSVTHVPDHQKFIVKTDRQFDIEVLGTVFTVFTRERGKKVLLNQGKVRISYLTGTDQHQLLMKPGDLVTMTPRGEVRLSQAAQPQQHTAWKYQRLVFDGTPLTEVCQMVAETFGVEVRIADERLASRKLSGTFSAKTADDLLNVVGELLDARPARKPGKVVELVPAVE